MWVSQYTKSVEEQINIHSIQISKNVFSPYELGHNSLNCAFLTHS